MLLKIHPLFAGEQFYLVDQLSFADCVSIFDPLRPTGRSQAPAVVKECFRKGRWDALVFR